MKEVQLYLAIIILLAGLSAWRPIVLAAAADSSGDAHLTVRAGTREASDDLDQRVQDLDRSRLLVPP